LQTWAESAAQLNLEKTNEVKDILSIVAKAAGEVGERDERYTKSFGDLADRLQETTKLNDLMEIRQSLSKGVTDIKACVASMAKDGQESVGSLRAQLSTYETRLEEVERIASVDPLTGLFNRRKIEAHLERQIKEGCGCSVIYDRSR
jgi:predicted component of type VI protein secretion system